jgi:hypothetical protein
MVGFASRSSLCRCYRAPVQRFFFIYTIGADTTYAIRDLPTPELRQKGALKERNEKLEKCTTALIEGCTRRLPCHPRGPNKHSPMFLWSVYVLIALTFGKYGLSIVPPIRNGNRNLLSFNVAPDSRAMVLVKKLFLVVISANPR